MRIHRLALEAFGPFPDAVAIDLDDLTSTGLFLIHGPTGAGKTSLLDAIAYALYADVPGSRSKKGLRSDHAPRDRVPRVELEFTAGGRRLRIRRSPEFVRPKLRGPGTVAVPAKVTLEEHRAGAWVAISARHDEIAEEIHTVLGMGLSQFAKVVVLPQGDFAAFLRASAEDRRELLERLFDITAFADVEAWLAERRRTSAAAADGAKTELAGLLARIDDATADAGSPGPDSPEVESAEHQDRIELGAADALEALTHTLHTLLDLADHEVSTALADADAASLAERSAAGALSTAIQRRDRRDRAHQALARLAALDAELDVQHARRVAIDRAHRAQHVSGHLAAWRRARNAAVAAESAVLGGTSALSAAGLPTGSQDLEVALRRLRTLDEVAHELDSLHGRSAALAERRAAAQERREATEQQVSALRAAVTDLEQREAAERTRLADLEQSAPDLDAARAGIRAVIDLDSLWAVVEADEAEVRELQARRRILQDDALAARTHHLDLRERHLDGMAAELADQLAPGHPCPVCGSAEHPDIASSADPVRREDLTAAEADAVAAQAAVREVDLALATVQAREAERRVGLGGLDRPGLDERRALAEEALRRAERAASELAELRLALVTTRSAVASHRGALQAAEIEAAGLTGTVQALREDEEHLAREIGRRRREHAGCPCRSAGPGEGPAAPGRARHDAVGELLGRVAELQRAHATALAEATLVERDTLSALAAASFDGVEAADAAALPADEVQALEDAVARHEADRIAAVALLADPDVAAELGAPAIDVEALVEADAQSRRQLLAAARALSRAESRRAVLARLVPATLEAADRRDQLRDQAQRVRDLADTVAGLGPGNVRRMRLTAYVLAARLERVVSFANDRLGVLGSGRYLLEHTDEKVGATRSGLGLRVLDQWTGQARDTSSLSGGETFMASLALALGLADAVRAESGGHDLSTLFIDEGFGSLDDESLEEVMAVLDGLQDGGRTVGVVSHVADLRTRIPRQLRVRKTPDGSFVTTSPSAASAAAS